MISENKISKFIGILIKETKNGKVEWKINNSRYVDSLEGEQKIIGYVYETKYLDRYLRLYKYNEPIQVDEYAYRDKVYFKLEFIDEKDKNLWSFPYYIRELPDLYNIVQIKSGEIDKFLDQFSGNEW